jgi:high-affinity iron transporter
MYSTWETLAAQVLAAVFVIGSYYAAERMKVKAPLARGEQPARRAEAPPEPVSQLA